MKTKISVIIADDHPLWRKAVSDLLLDYNEFEVVAYAGNGLELLNVLDQKTPDLIILDIRMPVMDGYNALKKIKEKYPKTYVIILSEYCDEEAIVVDFIDKGANFALSKSVTHENLISTIVSVMADEPNFNKNILKQLIYRDSRKKKSETLSDQEKEILMMFTKQKSVKEVAAHFFLSIATIKWHKANIYRKTHCLNEVGLTTYAFKRGWIY